MTNKVDDIIYNMKQWSNEISTLRNIALECGLNESVKWNQPCYMYHNKNILILASFKNYFSIGFFKGFLLRDPYKILAMPGENSNSVKMLKFNSIDEVKKLEKQIKEYIFEAIEIEKQGLKIEKPKNQKLNIIPELEEEFKKEPAFKEAFTKLTEGRKRAYIMHFESAKQSQTRTNRILNYKKRILDGYGLNDCVCGLSKRKPNCDGSHKLLNK